ncbi:MAG: NAD(P)/FAD-dependent oxidoreductase [Phascolarctobacterium faecium]
MLEKLQEHDNVVFILDSEVTAINGSERLESLGIRNKVSGEEQTLDVDAVLLLSAMFRIIKLSRLVELDAYGYIKTDENCATSRPGIYAAGDGRVKKVRQLTTAAADGTEAALAACDYIDLYDGRMGGTIFLRIVIPDEY